MPVFFNVTTNPMVPPAFTGLASAVLVPLTIGHVTVTIAVAFGCPPVLLDEPPNDAVFVTVPGTHADPVGTGAVTCSVIVAPAGSVNVPVVALPAPQLKTCGDVAVKAQVIAVPLGVTEFVFKIQA